MTTLKKSFKREIGVAGLIFWFACTAYLYMIADLDRVDAITSVYIGQTSFTWAYAAAAFGMHSLATQFGDK